VLLAVLFDGLLDAARVVGGHVHDARADLLVHTAEQLVVLGEVGVAEHVGAHERVVHVGIIVGQERVAGIPGVNDLEYA
jgi:hypothetical protein